ncbi:unnamed protein product [Kluyveromyces dobzhanskii CBS 2104]|uniref:WGS project CCBQ000000000 data, contig 00099 n=1 Tax=Kluyveromyces dobzhanskii CBS 2104 TaxID=1427455 RepID=A0A0A8L2N7_9SACH|nr:unnamed protein product [Kluyveromyces dobzhanskii CBS 2104]
MDPKIVGNSRVSSKPIGKPMPPVLEIVGSGEIAPMEKVPCKPTKKRMVRSPLAGEPITNMWLESNYIVMPITTEPVNASLESTIHKSVTSKTDEDLDDRPFLKYHERASKSDLLMDEIMNLYSNSEDSIERTPIIEQKIDEFIDTVHESLMNHKASRTVNAKIKRVDVKPVIVDENVTNKNSCSGTLDTEEITSNDVLNADISSPEYTTSGGSDQSSGGEEFSDLDSIAPVFKSPVSTSDESFYSCFDDIPRESEKHFTATNDVSLGRHFSARNMEATVIKTRVLEINDMVGFSDNEDEIETDLGPSLEEYIDMSNDPFIQIVDDTSSSMYSGSFT